MATLKEYEKDGHTALAGLYIAVGLLACIFGGIIGQELTPLYLGW